MNNKYIAATLALVAIALVILGVFAFKGNSGLDVSETSTGLEKSIRTELTSIYGAATVKDVACAEQGTNKFKFSCYAHVKDYGEIVGVSIEATCGAETGDCVWKTT
jgi:hypothetical protein